MTEGILFASDESAVEDETFVVIPINQSYDSANTEDSLLSDWSLDDFVHTRAVVSRISDLVRASKLDVSFDELGEQARTVIREGRTDAIKAIADIVLPAIAHTDIATFWLQNITLEKGGYLYGAWLLERALAHDNVKIRFAAASNLRTASNVPSTVIQQRLDQEPNARVRQMLMTALTNS